MNDNENLKSLYNTLQKEGYTPPVFEQFAKDMEDDSNLRGVYSTLQNEGYTPPDYDTFRSDMGLGKVAKTNPKVKVGSHAQQVVDEYDRSVAENSNNTPLSTPEQERQPVQSQESTPRAQFVPEYSNVKGFTVAKDSPLRQQYPFLAQLGEDEQAYFRTDTNEPLYAWKDSEGKDITPDEAATLNQRADIEQNDAIRPRQVPVTSLQLPEEVKSSGIRTDKKVSEYADELLKQQYGDGYWDKIFTDENGNEISGEELRNNLAQETYNALTDDIRKARIALFEAGGDKEAEAEINTGMANKWQGVMSDKRMLETLHDENAMKQDVKDYAQGEIDKAREEERRIIEEMNKRGEELDAASSPYVDQTFNTRQVDNRYTFLTTKLNAVRDRIRSWEAVRDSDDYGAMRALKDTAGNLRSWDLGYSDMIKGMHLVFGTEQDKKELANLLGNAERAKNFEQKAISDFARYVQIGGQSLPFMATFVGSGGGFRTLSEGVAKGAVKWAERKALQGIQKNAVKYLGVAAGDILAGYTLSGTLQGMGTLGDIMQRRAGDIEYNTEKGKYELVNPRGWAESAYKGATASMIDNATELLGDHLNIGKAAMKLLPKAGLKQVSDWLTKAGKSELYTTTREWLKRAGINGLGGEILEEEMAIPMNAVFVGDNPLLFGDGGLLDAKTQKDIVFGVGLSVFAMNAAAVSLHGTGQGINALQTMFDKDQRRLDAADNTAIEIIGGHKWTEIKNEIDNATNEELADVAQKIADDKELNEEQKKAAGEYVTSTLQMRGHNLGENAAMQSNEQRDAYLDSVLSTEERQNVHDDGMIHAAVLYPTAENNGQPQEVFITKGNIVMNADGTINAEASDKEIYYKGADGQAHITSPDKFQSVAQPINVEEYAAANAPQEAQAGYTPGQQVSVNIDGQDIQGEVTNVGEDGNVLVSFENPDGTLSSRWLAPEELEQSNGRIAEGQEEIHNGQPPITDEYSRFVDSGIVSDDTVALIADKIANGQQLTPEEESMRQGAVERVENLLKEKQNGQNRQTAQVEQASQPQQTEASVQEQTALSRIPVDEKGKPAYDKAEPDLAWDAIMEKTDGDEEMAKNVVDAMVKQQETEVDKLKKKQPKAIPGDVDSMIAAQKEKKAAIAAAEERLEQWRKIADTPNRRAAATNVQPTQNPSDETSTQPATAIAPTENTGNVEPADTGNAQTTEQGTEVPTGVQGTVEDGTVPEETNRGEDKEYQLSETDTQSEQVKQDNIRTIDPRSMSNDERQQRGDMLRNAPAIEVKAGQIVSTPELSARKVAERWWDENVPEPVFYDTEVGEVEINKNSVESSLAHRYGQAKLDAITSLVDGFENAVYLGTLPDFTRQEGVLSHYFAYPIIYNDKRCYVFCRAMQDANKNRLYVHEVFVAENIKRGDTLQTAASQPHGGIALYKDILGNVLEEAPKQQSLLNGNNPRQYPANRELSESKDTQTSANEQTVGEKIAEEEAKVEQNPTEAQKEAGNYKKGHVKIDGYDVTIENPKGSVRSGVDRNGQEWSVTMNNTYGYIRGTEGVDGDHIDVFLSDDPTQGYVYVIDQVNENGSFDEHKVMYGFNSVEEARDAYLANYSPGWQGLGTITEVSKEEFKKWINSSHRKIKPFAEYKSVNKDGAQNEGNTLANEAHELFSDIIAQSTHNVEINDSGISETDNTLYAPIKVDGKDTSLSLYQEEPAHSSEEPIVGVSFYRDGMTYQEAADLSDEYNKYVGERVCADGSDELAINFGSIDEAVRFEEWLNDNRGVRFREADNEISDFAQKHNLNEKDVQDYADYMRQGNLNGASGAFHDIRRKIRIDNKGVSLGQFAKIFSPIRKELYEKFGNIDEMREQYVQHELEERSVMEAVRKRAEEAAEAERRRLQVFQDMSDEQLDEEYSKAVESNDESRMRDLVNEAARRNGYGDVGSEYQGVGAWSAPSNPGYESDEERRAAVENDAPDVNITDIANGYSQQPSDYFTNLRAYGTDTPHGRESAEAINKAIDEVRNGKDPMVKVYRAVPKSVKEGKLRNGDWVTPSRKYAEMHGDNRLEGDYRIIEQEVPASQLWWDGNDINEWGFDDGKGYAYRNTKNNRKLNDLITRDDKGNIIPLSQRFNARKADVRYRNTENQAATDNIEDVNKQFNQQLEGLTEENADKVTLSLGRPSAVLRAAGVEDKPMKLYGNKVIKKMRKHGFTLAEIKDLPRAVADPIAVFNNYQKNGNRSILTELQIGDKHILVSVTVGKTGVDADFNIVSSVFGKGSNNVVDWINKGYATFINKEKALDYLHFSERSISEASDNQELVSTANIIRNFENPNVLEENLVPTEQTNDIDTAVADTANKLNIGVRVAHSVDEVSDEGVRRAIEQGRNVKGWYDTRTGEIVVYAPNATDADDAVRTVLHEGVAHYGLRQLVGDENFDTFLDNIYNNVDGEIKAAIDEKAQRNGWSTRVATEEYLASLAEDTNFETARSSGLWQRIKDFFMDLLTKAGIRLNEALTDNELRYILWRSYENLQEPNGRGTIGTVRDVAMQGRLGVGNYGNEDVRLREAEDEQTPEKKSENKYRELYDKRVSRRRARLNRSYFDSMQPVKVLQKTITEETGQQIRPEENVYLQENRANSMAQRKHEMWERGHMEPARREVTKLMQQIMGGNWLTRRFKLPKTRRNAYNAVVRYMKSKHGLENNEYRRNMEAEAAREPFEAEIGAVEKLVKDGNISRAEADKRQAELKEQADKAETESRAKTLNKDYSGLQGIYGKDFERKAKEYVENFEGAYDTAPLWREWSGATKAILEEEYKSGLLSKELYDRIRNMYKYYIPLKGWAENRAEDVYTYYATGSGDGGKPHRREGRTSESDDPLVTLEQDADRQFTAAARNRTKQKLYNLATAHKSSLLTVRRQWYQNMGTKENPDWQRKDPEIPENATPEQMEQIIKDFEKDMRKLEKEGTAMRQKKPMILPYHATKSMEKEHTVRVMVNGKEYVIYVNGNPAAAQAVNGTSTPQDPDGSVLKRIYGALRWINRVKASLLTAVNVNFIPSNLVRDAQYSIQNMKAKEPVGYVLKYVKNLGEGMAKMTSARLFYKDKQGTLNMNDKTERLFKEFLDNGGETGYTARYTLEKQRRRNMAAINRMTGIDWLAGLRMLQHSLEYVNRSVETIVRFAAYKTSREVGRSIAQSINDAKEASVNFDKHGSGELGNKEWRLAYIFSNVGFQALRRLMENASGHPVRFTLAQIERFALGFVVPMMAKAMLDAYGDDDEKDAYEALPEWMRESGLAVPVSPILRKVGADDAADKVKRVFLYLPLGPEDKIWYALGENTWHLFNKDNITVEEAMDMAVKFGSLAADLLPLDFQGYGGNPIVSLAPTPVQDFVALEQNVNYWGQPIYRESTNYNEHDPGHRLAFTGTPEWYVERAEDINRLTGGDEYTKGWLSPKPEQIEYFINQTGGGVTRVVNQVMSLIERAGEDGNKDIQVLKNVPVVSSLAKKADVQDGKDGFDREKYYDYIDEYEKALHDYNAYRKAKRNGDDEAGQKAEKLKESPTGERMDIIRKDIRKIRNKDKQVRRIDEKENPTAEEEARRDKLKTESNELKQKLLEKLDKVKEKPGKQ